MGKTESVSERETESESESVDLNFLINSGDSIVC
jgi:hypothetical protein